MNSQRNKPEDFQTAYRTCPFCESTCGLEITLQGGRVVSVKGDKDDVFSKGYLCPKGAALADLHYDPDRLRHPLIKKNGSFVEVGWDEAFVAVESGLAPLMENYGRDAVAAYVGNPVPEAFLQGVGEPKHLQRQHCGPDPQTRIQRPHVR